MSAPEEQAQPFQCQYCQRRFKRLEHTQRHERRHTKEAPYECPCGKAFPRGDLLRRHEKSAHNIDTTRRNRSSTYGLATPANLRTQSSGKTRELLNEGWLQGRSTSFSDSRTEHVDSQASRTALQDSTTQRHVQSRTANGIPENDGGLRPPFRSPNGNNILSLGQTNDIGHQATGLPLADQAYVMDTMMFNEPITDPFDLFGEGDAFLENVDFSSLFLPAGFGLDQDLQIDYPPSSNSALRDTATLQAQAVKDPSAEQNSISRFGSPLPSIRSDPKVTAKQPTQRPYAFTRPVPCWKISKSDYSAIEDSVRPLSAALPQNFTLPTRHTASRYLEGCIRGLYEHMPFLHIPTWTVRTAAPDLILSMFAAGAQFKFEGNKVMSLFYAAKAAINYQLRVKDIKVAGAFSRGLNQRSNTFGVSTSAESELGTETYSTANESNGPASVDIDRLQTMQAILNLMVLGSWGPRQLVGEAIAFQSLLAELVRADGLGEEPEYGNESCSRENRREAWLEWVRIESLRRTKLFAYTFLNLQSVAYNVAPCVLTTEVQINTPAGQDEWNAKTSESWMLALKSSKIVSTGFMSAYRSLFQATTSESSTPTPPSSALANYALIFAILQCIFLLREGRATLPYADTSQNIRSEDVETLSSALQRWQARWENSPESTIEPVSSSGPVAFNSTALLRLAWIRLHADLGPCRNLASRDPTLIVEAFKSCPPLNRHTGLAFPIIQAAHTLSIPVRLGIAYVAKTQTLSWSVQHSLCNLECAIFVSKWFDTIASTISTTPLTAQEVGLIYMFRSIVQETGFFKDEAFEPATDEQGWQRLIRHLGTAVAMLWAETFSGTHVFEMVSTIGQSLGIYAKHLEDAHTPINAGHH